MVRLCLSVCGRDPALKSLATVTAAQNRAGSELSGKYEGKSLNNRNFILKCIEKYKQRKILFRDTKWLLSNMSYRGRDDQAV